MNAILLSVLTFVSCTECPKEVREFLSVPGEIKCEMVKWRLVIENNDYEVTANWAGGKSNFKGKCSFRSGIYILKNKSASVSLRRLNNNILQILDKNGKMLPGGEGYSTMLTRVDPVEDKSINFAVKDVMKEDIVLAGRTPLKPFDREFPIFDNEGHDKIKWLIRLYADGRVEVREILEHPYDYKGKWTFESGVYKLEFEGKQLLLVRGSEDIFFFVSKEGGLINGNDEFGSSLIRRHSPSAR